MENISISSQLGWNRIPLGNQKEEYWHEKLGIVFSFLLPRASNSIPDIMNNVLTEW